MESKKTPKRAPLPDTFSAPPSINVPPHSRHLTARGGPRPGACRWAEPSGDFTPHAAASEITQSTYIHARTHAICVGSKLDAEDPHAKLATGLEAGPCLVCLNTAPLFSGSTKPPLLTLKYSTGGKISPFFLFLYIDTFSFDGFPPMLSLVIYSSFVS